ncbi:Uncharacterised protein [Klebsiella michiganensis]|nr:Uncharacterised protein [Klebsiella michiganensis]
MMLAPAPWLISVGSSAWVTLTSPVTLVSIIVFQSSRSTFCAGCGDSASPALLISVVISAKPAGSAATAAATASLSRTSSSIMCTGTCEASLSCSVFSRAKRRPLSTSDQPASAKTCAAASPNPEVAPVINTTLLVAISFSCAGCRSHYKNRARAGTGPVGARRCDTVSHHFRLTGSIRFSPARPMMRTTTTT